ncbi:uncharacterized protein SPAPADRAFT_57528 [Spathaspora passalidarum NRRL Y-27907]|uniref:Mitochondrial acidic protein MAM33 n=1 Tax=Spathaspora passalidarum (strain NRRL Y-27907 / 11-Y1) TaxID=619300 RepID=G3AUX0_SPAPN|nr:uncharacterized protein SPAPADRAFT_57528 [Spathaspora passalidarum NRRL Y-27907]EGW30061.1 hypothetical protein SPAPADRAFT_57528 [Spathaspora passalidarum NRRL Y-27907]
MSKLLSSTLRTQLSKRLAIATSRSIRTPVIAALPKLVASTSIRSFSSTQIIRKQSSSESSLKAVIEGELKVAEEIPNELDAGFEEYLSSQGYKVITKEGNANVELIRTDASGHVIHVYFDVEEVTDLSEEFSEFQEENEWADEDEDSESFGNGFFSKFKVFIEDPATNDGLNFDLFLKNIESGFSVECVNYQPNATEFISEVSKGNFTDKFRYEGPKFEDLDESLQVEFENYLTAKGIDEKLAEFIVAYSEHKEESEYRGWLSSISKFLK